MTPLPYTAEESDHAHREWKATCGHHSIAAATHRPLHAIRDSGVRLCGWMNPTMVSQCLRSLGADFTLKPIAADQHPYLEFVDGNTGLDRIFRVQFLGPWMQGPVTGQYRKTHYIACLQRGILDTIYSPTTILSHEAWYEDAQEFYPQSSKGCTGFCFTHAWSISMPST